MQRMIDLGQRLGGHATEGALRKAIVAEAKALLGAQRVLLVLYSADGVMEIADAALPRTEAADALQLAVTPWLDEARGTGESRLRRGPDGAAPSAQRSCLVATLVAPQGPLGCLYADIDGAKGRFEDGDRVMLSMLASQAATALAHLRRVAALQVEVEMRTAKEHAASTAQQATAEVLQVIGSSMTDTQPVFDAIVRNCSTLLHGSRVVFWLVESDGVRARSSNGQLPGLVLPMDQSSAIGACILESRVIHLPDLLAAAQQYPLLLQLGVKSGYGSGLYTPMLHEGRAIGALAVLQKAANAFDASDVALLQPFAAQAVIAVQNVRLFKDTQEALERQTATTEVLEVINASPGDISPVFDTIARKAMQLCDADHCGLWNVEGEVAIGAGHYNVPEAYLPHVMNQRVLVKHLYGPVAGGPPFVQVPDIRELKPYQKRHPRALADVEVGGIRTYLCVPLRDGDTVIGLFALNRKEVRPFSDKQIALVQAFAAQAQIAMKNARLIKETREALEQQTATAEVLQVISGSVADTAPVFDKILRSCQRLFDSGQVAIALIGEDGLMHFDTEIAIAAERGGEQGRNAAALIKAQFPRPVRDSIHGYAIHKRQVLHYPDVMHGVDVPDGLRVTTELVGNYSMIVAPLMWEDQGIGGLQVVRMPPAPFSDRDISLLKTFADQAVIAIQNARLFNETQEALSRETASAEILRVVSGSPTDVQPVFNAIVRTAVPLIACDRAAIMLCDAISFWVAASSRGQAFQASGKRIPIDPQANFPSRVIMDKTMLHVPDLQATDLPEFERKVHAAGDFKSVLMLPLVRGDQCIGVLGLLRARAGSFSAKEIALAESFRDQAMIAIENVRLFNEIGRAHV